jgi:hypothetical protein
MYVALDCNDISKLLFAITNLYILDKQERIKPSVYYSLIKLYINGYAQFSDHSKKYYKDRINEIFRMFTEKDGITFDIWDLYIYWIQTVELEMLKITDEKQLEEVYKKQMDLRLKQARTLMIPEWEKDERVIDKLKAVLAKIREEINRNKNETFVKEVKTFVETVEVKIDRYYKTKEYDNMLK